MVEIEVLDFNDCPPIFVTPPASTTVLEDAVNGSVIVEYTITDCDSGLNGVNGTTFSIIAGIACPNKKTTLDAPPMQILIPVSCR